MWVLKKNMRLNSQVYKLHWRMWTLKVMEKLNVIVEKCCQMQEREHIGAVISQLLNSHKKGKQQYSWKLKFQNECKLCYRSKKILFMLWCHEFVIGMSLKWLINVKFNWIFFSHLFTQDYLRVHTSGLCSVLNVLFLQNVDKIIITCNFIAKNRFKKIEKLRNTWSDFLCPLSGSLGVSSSNIRQILRHITNITRTGSATVNWNRRLLIQGVTTVIMVSIRDLGLF